MSESDFFWTIVGQVVIFWLGYKLGQHITAVKVTKMLIDNDPNIQRMVERARAELKKLDLQEEIKQAGGEPLRVERHADQIYLFQKDSNEFLAQGTSLQEALERVEQRFPDRTFKGHISKEEADQLGVTIK